MSSAKSSSRPVADSIKSGTESGLAKLNEALTQCLESVKNENGSDFVEKSKNELASLLASAKQLQSKILTLTGVTANENNEMESKTVDNDYRSQSDKFLELMSGIDTSDDCAHQLDNLTDLIKEISNSDHVCIYSISENEITCEASTLVDMFHWQVNLENCGILSNIIKEDKALFLSNVYSNKLFDKTIDERINPISLINNNQNNKNNNNSKENSKTYCLGLEPVYSEGNQLIGIIETIYCKPNEKSYDTYKHSIDFITSSNNENDNNIVNIPNTRQKHLKYSMYNLTSIMLSRSILQSSEMTNARQKSALLTLAKVVGNPTTAISSNIESLIENVRKTIYNSLKCDKVALFLVDEINQDIWCKSSDDVAGLRLPLNKGIIGECINKGISLNIRDAYSDSRFNDKIDQITNYTTKTILCVPIIYESKIIGAIQCLNKKNNEYFNNNDLKILSAMALQAAPALQNKFAQSALRIILETLQDNTSKKYLAQFMDRDITHAILAHIDSGTGNGGDNDDHNTIKNNFFKTYDRRSQAMIVPNINSPRASGNNSILANKPLLKAHGSTGGGSGSINALNGVNDVVPQSAPAGFPGNNNSSKFSYPKPMPAVSNKAENRFIEQLNSWDFDYFGLENEGLELYGIPLIIRMFQKFDLLKKYNIKDEVLGNFIRLVSKRYFDNPYHNFLHAFNVTHVSYLILSQTSILRYFSSLDVFIALIASLCHDIEHPGFTNGHIINSESTLAMLYNDKSVLENHHCYVTSLLLFKPNEEDNSDILYDLNNLDKKYFRNNVITKILHTDMSLHSSIVSELSNIALKLTSIDNMQQSRSLDDYKYDKKKKQQHIPAPSKEDLTRKIGLILDENDEKILATSLVHIADINTAVLGWNRFHEFSLRLMNEFSKQCEIEKEKGLPVQISINKNDPKSISQMQVSYVDYVVKPLWLNIHSIIPELEHRLKRLLKNRELWKDYAKTGFVPENEDHISWFKGKYNNNNNNNNNKGKTKDESKDDK